MICDIGVSVRMKGKKERKKEEKRKEKRGGKKNSNIVSIRIRKRKKVIGQ